MSIYTKNQKTKSYFRRGRCKKYYCEIDYSEKEKTNNTPILESIYLCSRESIIKINSDTYSVNDCVLHRYLYKNKYLFKITINNITTHINNTLGKNIFTYISSKLK